MISQETIQEVVQRLVKAYNPLEIYLFGSYAYGKPNDSSDLDVLVVVEGSEEKWYKRVVLGYKALSGLELSEDLLVYTQKEFQESARNESTLSYCIKNKGKRVYARA